MGRAVRKTEASVTSVTVNTGTGEPQGDDTEIITFENPFEEIPSIILCLNEPLTTTKVMTYLAAKTITAGGFVIDWESDENTKASLDIAWIAMEKRSHDRS